ncbi:ATP-binding protein [Priestia filamentosa]|uniref:AAA family ATPase n=1 Tax=Priestia filamentosa TaxID=1402861 RepID=UPI003F187F69
MLFKVMPVGFIAQPSLDARVYLIKDDWNDWWDYKTLFSLVFVKDFQVYHIGQVKIGQFNMKIDETKAVSPDLPDSFTRLGPGFFSLGQDVSYYTKLNELGEDIRYGILSNLSDVALDENLFEKAFHEDVMGRSLLRFVTRNSVKGQYRRLANGDASLTDYKFTYRTTQYDTNFPVELSFEVTPESNPPTNIHILIGRNGVGKTHMLNNMIKSLIEPDNETGSFSSDLEYDSQELFANLVSVSFSAFDYTKPLAERENNSQGIKYSYVGLQQTIDKVKEKTKDSKEIHEDSFPKSTKMLGEEFKLSLEFIKKGAKVARWLEAVKTLETDPIFKNIGISLLIEDQNFHLCEKLFDMLSSGHKIVLLTITKLVETVEERTLVLLDEPEGHLHPPLLSAFTRALSDLLKFRNGVAIIATHSPVVLQEVPKSCVWIIHRNNREGTIERPEIETFGENVGTLTREVFGLEVTNSGFHRRLKEAVEEIGDFDKTIDYFNNELGMEARAIIRALLVYRD